MAFSATQNTNVEPLFDAIAVSSIDYASLDNLSHYAIPAFSSLQPGDIFEVQTPSDEANLVSVDTAGMVTGTANDNFKYTLIDGVTFQRLHAQGNELSGVVGQPPNADTTPPVITLVGAATVQVSYGGTYTEQGATATDDTDGDISGSIVIGGSVDTNTVGSYSITYNVSDLSGNAATEVTRTVNVVDDQSPIITLLGSAVVDITEGDTYTDAGATATDNVDGNLTLSIVEGGSVDINTVGTYVLTYDVDDAAGNSAVQVTRTVNVNAAPDTTPPVITLIGSATINLEYGSVYSEQGATATDNEDGNITGNIVIGGDTVNTSALGTYTVTYNVSDAAGNAATEVTRTVTVIDTQNPVLTITGVPAVISDTTPFEITNSFNEDVAGFVVGDISVSNGSVSGFSADSASSYRATITPDGNGDVVVSVSANAAQDGSGNPSTAASETAIFTVADIEPNQYDFGADVTDANPGQVIVRTDTIAGIDPGETIPTTATGDGSVASPTGQLGDTVELTITASTTFDASVTGGVTSNGVSDSVIVTTRSAIAPTITTQPQSQTITEGSNLTLSIVATNYDSLQWQKDGADIPGETGSSLTITNVQQSDAGTYRVVVTGETNVNSNGAVIGVNSVTNPSDDLYYMPALLATSVQSVTAYRDRGNKHCIRITHDGEAVDLTAFSRFELFGLNTGGIDSAVNPGAFDATTGNGKLVLDVGSLITANSPAKTTLIGYSSSEPEGVVLWDKSIASSRVTFNIH